MNKALEMTMEELDVKINEGWVVDLDLAIEEKSNLVTRFIDGNIFNCMRDNLQLIVVTDLEY